MSEHRRLIFNVGKGDTLPVLAIQATFEDVDGVEKPFPLTGWAVVFNMRREGASGSPTVDAATAVVDNALNGIMHYAWAPGDTDAAGQYEADFVATQGSDQITFPNKRPKIRVIVGEDAA